MGDEISSSMKDIEPDSQICVRCGQRSLDTGWECADCGFDNINIYYPDRPPDKLCPHCLYWTTTYKSTCIICAEAHGHPVTPYKKETP